MNVKANLNHKRQYDLEKVESHIILINVTKKNFGLASIYRTYKVTHEMMYKEALSSEVVCSNTRKCNDNGRHQF